MFRKSATPATISCIAPPESRNPCVRVPTTESRSIAAPPVAGEHQSQQHRLNLAHPRASVAAIINHSAPSSSSHLLSLLSFFLFLSFQSPPESCYFRIVPGHGHGLQGCFWDL